MNKFGLMSLIVFSVLKYIKKIRRYKKEIYETLINETTKNNQRIKQISRNKCDKIRHKKTNKNSLFIKN